MDHFSLERGQRTLLVVACIPFVVSRDRLAHLERYHSPSECNDKPASPTCDASDTFPKLKFRHFSPECLIPNNDLIWRVQGTWPTAHQKEDRGGM